MRQPRITHEAPRGIRQFTLLEMKSRVREAVEIAHMVVMQMGQDDILDVAGVDSERADRLHRATQEGSLSPLRYFRVESGIDDEAASFPLCQPHEVVHRHRAVVRI